MKIGIIIGSSRPGRVGASIADWVQGQLPASSDISYELIDLRDENLPMFDEEIIPMMGNYQNEHTKRWAAKIANLDGFVVVTPEYNAGYPAVLKNAIDYLKAEWQNKPVTIVSYGHGGGASSNHQLVEVFTRIGSKITDTLPQLTFRPEIFGDKGQITDVAAAFSASAADVTKSGQELIALK